MKKQSREFHDGRHDGLMALESLDLDRVHSFAELLRAMSKTAFGGRALGEAFEVTREMVETWFVSGERELPKPIADLRAETDRLIGPWNRHGRALCEAFLEVATRRKHR